MQLVKSKNGKTDDKPVKNGKTAGAPVAWSGSIGRPTKSRS